jgi:hypothetical protein
MDSGTTHHIFRNRELFGLDFRPVRIPITHAGNGHIYAEGTGSVSLELELPSGRTITHVFENSLFVPAASRDLVSTTELEEQGHAVLFKKGDSQLILESDVRIPLKARGRLRTLPLATPTLPALRKTGWTGISAWLTSGNVNETDAPETFPVNFHAQKTDVPETSGR